MEKIVKKTFTVITNYFDLLIFFISVFSIDLSVRIITNLEFGKLPIVFDVAILSLIALILIWFKNKIRLTIEFILILLLSIYSFAQSLHFIYFANFFSFKKLSVIGELAGVSNEIFTKINSKFIIFVLPIIFFIFFILLVKNKKDNSDITYINKFIIEIGLFLIVVSSYFMIDTNLKEGAEKENWLSDQYLLDSFHNSVRFYDRFGIMEYIIRDIQLSTGQKSGEKATVEEKNDIKNYINEFCIKQEHNDMTGIYKDKNLILILAESLNNFAINNELTPTLYKVKENGYYFDNFYAPIYQSATGDSEFISLTSMLPSVDYGTTSYTFHNNSYPKSLPNLFKKEGYRSNSYHSYITNFYNRELFHSSLGFEVFYDESKLGIERSKYFIDGFNWNNDDFLFNRTIANTKYEEGPFFDFVITTSGHMPYVEERDEIFLNLDEIENSSYSYLSNESKCYLAAQMNFDKGLKQLIDDLEGIGQLDNTIIIIFGDHYPYGISSGEAIQEVIEHDDYKKYKVPFIIYDHSNETGNIISKLGSTFDIYPTICNLFELNHDNAFTVGIDLFSKNKSIIPFSDRSILTDDFYYNSLTNKIVVLSQTYDEIRKDKILNKINKMFDIGQLILRKDYYEEN